MIDGMFGGMFDFNGDGQMNSFESGLECQFFHEVIMGEDRKSSSGSDWWEDDDSGWDDDDY